MLGLEPLKAEETKTLDALEAVKVQEAPKEPEKPTSALSQRLAAARGHARQWFHGG